jgi:hypothetical protein
MRNLFIMITGFIVAGFGVTALALALPEGTNSGSARPTAATKKAMPMNGMASMSSGTMSAPSLAGAKLTIRHVQRGCHVWAHGSMTGTTMRLHLRVGQHLSILDQDVDAHQLLELAGPMRLHMGGPMMTNHGTTIAFMKSGVYRLGTKTVEMPGMGMGDVKTIGPDNKLRLVVTAA